MSNFFIDGDFTYRTQTGLLIENRDPETRALIYRRTVRQLKANFEPLLQSATNKVYIKDRDIRTVPFSGAVCAYFVEESLPRDLGAGVIEFDETYAEIPDSYTEATSLSHSYQYILPTISTFFFSPTVTETTLSTSAKVVHSFGLVDYDGSTDIVVHVAPRYVSVFDIATIVGDFNYHSSEGATDILHQDTILERWKGPIFRAKEIFVPQRIPTSV